MSGDSIHLLQHLNSCGQASLDSYYFNRGMSSGSAFQVDMDEILIRLKAEDKEGWTDDKHRSYLNLIETVFTENLYGREYCAADVCGSPPEHMIALQKQFCVDNNSIMHKDLSSPKKHLVSQDAVLHLQSIGPPHSAYCPCVRRFTNDPHDNSGTFGTAGETGEYGDSEMLDEENAAREIKTQKRKLLLEVPDIEKKSRFNQGSSESRSNPTGGCIMVLKRQRLQKKEINNINLSKGNGKKSKSQQNISVPDLEHKERHATLHRAEGRDVQISTRMKLKQFQNRPLDRRRIGLQIHFIDDALKYAQAQGQMIRFSKQQFALAEEIADSDQVVPSSGDDETQNHDFAVSNLIVTQSKSDSLSSSTLKVTVKKGE